jgi:hypothetical protein
MKCAVEMISGGMAYIPSFIKIASGIQMLLRWVHIQTARWSHKTTFLMLKQEVLGRSSRLLSLIRDGPHWKRRVQQFFYCCLCIRYRGSVSTEPLPSNYKGTFTEPFPSKDKGWYSDTHTRARTNTQTATWSHEPTLFFQNRKVG